MVLLTRAVAVFALNAALGLLASAASGAVAALTFGWLLPMTAVSALALAAAVVARSAVVGAGAGVAAWVITVLAGQTASGQLTASVTNAHAYLPYLAVAACCAAVVIYAVRPRKGPPVNVILTSIHRSFGKNKAVDGVSLAAGVGGFRPARPQRGREDLPAAHARHRAAAVVG